MMLFNMQKISVFVCKSNSLFVKTRCAMWLSCLRAPRFLLARELDEACVSKKKTAYKSLKFT